MVDYSNTIIDYLRTNGPSNPIQLGQAIKRDSFMASAILIEIAGKTEVRATKGKIGSSPLYYLPEQEEEAKSRIFSALSFVEKKLVSKIKESKYVLDTELSVQEKFVMKSCLDFIVPLDVNTGEYQARVWKYYTTPDEIIKARFDSPKSRAPRQETQKKIESVKKPEESIFKEKKEESMKEKDDIFSNAAEVIEQMNAEIINKNKKNTREASMIVKTNGVFAQKYYIKIHMKKRINQSDISLAFTEGNDKKMPVIFITNGKISKTNLENSRKKFGELLKIVNV